MTSEAKVVGHTPGPWVVRMASTCSAAWPEIVPADADEYAESLAEASTAFVFDHDRVDANEVAGGYDEHPEYFVPDEDHDEVMANARLIAAAPDLLDACMDARQALGSIYIRMGSQDGMKPLLDKVSAAIARATEG